MVHVRLTRGGVSRRLPFVMTIAFRFTARRARVRERNIALTSMDRGERDGITRVVSSDTTAVTSSCPVPSERFGQENRFPRRYGFDFHLTVLIVTSPPSDWFPFEASDRGRAAGRTSGDEYLPEPLPSFYSPSRIQYEIIVGVFLFLLLA